MTDQQRPYAGLTLVGVLTDARHEIERGWIQGSAISENGACISGALDLSVWVNDGRGERSGAACRLQSKAARLLRKQIHEMWPEFPVGRDGLPEGADWNDDPARTKQDVLDLFDKSISSAQEPAEGWTKLATL